MHTPLNKNARFTPIRTNVNICWVFVQWSIHVAIPVLFSTTQMFLSQNKNIESIHLPVLKQSYCPEKQMKFEAFIITEMWNVLKNGNIQLTVSDASSPKLREATNGTVAIAMKMITLNICLPKSKQNCIGNVFWIMKCNILNKHFN